MKSLFFIFLMVVGCGVAVGLTREYIFLPYHFSWYSAQSHCRQHYRDLATVTSNDENKRLLQSGLSNFDSWIGLYMSYSGTWTWADGDPLLYRKWNEGSPYFIYNNTCAYTYYNGFWLNGYYDNGKTFYCYRFLILVKENKTWEEAQEFCRTNYTGLASVTSEWSLRQLNLETVGTETESMWTGLRFMNGQWVWVSGEQLGSLVSMSSCQDPSSCCGALNTTTNTLKNQNCNEKMNFICYWIQHYRGLATVTYKEEHERLLQSGLSRYYSWIGLYMSYSGTWTWADGDPSLFQKWNEGSLYFQYNNYCAYTYYNGLWLDGYCENGKSFYCYRFLILVKENKTWEEAQEFCRTNYTGLASVTSETSLRQLNLEAVGTETESVWTRLCFMNGQWFWVSGEQLGSLVSMPLCPALSYRCGSLNITTNTLKNQNCNEKMNFICYWA
ncbi:hypothetical protein QTP70_021681 [Hemibagrus guttatus]|uniref:C-type lectin domain-containing protein n=1 Tax=Hemibagrus guttatus TaxID=175788 RepID=A0AAE0RAM5_9TELE|nr:hypothetical protein QTP70_021681 [Hemibagrus guttatus]